MSTRKSRGKIQVESPHYRVYKKQPHLLYVAGGAKIPSVLVRDTENSLDAKKYAPYKYRHPFYSEDNDCLRFAESLVLGIVGYAEKACAYTVNGTHRKFGATDKGNIELALKHRKDVDANPRRGQAYAVVRTNLWKALEDGEDLPPYHIAHVIVEDGDWRITLEADAGNPDLEKPVFGIYSTTDETKSFHRMYRNLYGKDAAATIVLEKN